MATQAQYKAITAEIIAALERGTVPWEKPWKAPKRDGFNPNIPHNGQTGHAYRGLNPLVLWSVASAMGYQSQTWLTFNQAKNLGGFIKKGQRSTLVSFWKFETRYVEEKDETTGEIVRKKVKNSPMLRMYQVFNLEQTENVKLPKKIANREDIRILSGETIDDPEDNVNVHDLAQSFADGYLTGPNGPEIRHHDLDRAYYQVQADRVSVPKRSSFKNPEGYYATLFHELGHSTGHESRLGRFDEKQLLAAFGSEDYSKEELVAELTASFLCAESGIDNTREHHASYIASWLRVLRDDMSMVSKAATKAQKAADLVLAASTQSDESTDE